MIGNALKIPVLVQDFEVLLPLEVALEFDGGVGEVCNVGGQISWRREVLDVDVRMRWHEVVVDCFRGAHHYRDGGFRVPVPPEFLREVLVAV